MAIGLGSTSSVHRIFFASVLMLVPTTGGSASSSRRCRLNLFRETSIIVMSKMSMAAASKASTMRSMFASGGKIAAKISKPSVLMELVGNGVGRGVGEREGPMVGRLVGAAVGAGVGFCVGDRVGLLVGV